MFQDKFGADHLHNISQNMPVLLIRLPFGAVQDTIGEINMVNSSFFGPLFGIAHNILCNVFAHRIVKAPGSTF
jgi:hypothetical protein